MKNLGITRREILKGAAGAAAAAAAGCSHEVLKQSLDGGPNAEAISACGCPPRAAEETSSAGDEPGQPEPVTGRSKVVTVQREDSLNENLKPKLEVVQQMVDSLLSSLAGGADNPWPVLLPGADKCTRIGLKVNCLTSRTPTSPAVVLAVVRNLVERGNFCAGNIVIWERYRVEMGDLYAEAQKLGARLVGTNDAPSPDGAGPDVQGSGPGYGAPLDGFRGRDPEVKPRLSKVLTHLTDVTINLPVLKAHPHCGITVAIKACYGMFDCPANFHPPYLHEEMPRFYALPQIRGRIKLTILDALRASVSANIASPPDCSPGRIAASRDPLALDYYALDLVNQLRTKPKPPNRPTEPVDARFLAWMENAYALGLGAKSYTLVTPGADGDVTFDGGVADASEQSG